MALSSTLLGLLDHLGKTVTIGELAANPDHPDRVALRHDVDHDLDLALEVAQQECRRGQRATYFLLHTAPYWTDPHFPEKCRQLAAYGHEIGLHVNVLTEWMRREIDDVEDRLAELLARLRATGVEVVGVSAHGDRRCYEDGFSNAWLWQELRGSDPAAREAGRTAEGVTTDNPERQLPYPENHVLVRADGARFPLWSVSLEQLGLRYEAFRVPHDCYWSDTGGRWRNGADPAEADLLHGRHQLLIHPYWWRKEPTITFVLSTARSGSLWLSRFVDQATSARGLHEWTLNHRRDGDDYVPDKRTTSDYATLVERPPLARAALRAAVAHHRTRNRDLVEANVYIEPFIEELRDLCPEARFVHLHRDGRDVVRSILQRGWYAHPIDRAHRTVPIPEWDLLSQFERACWYWRFTNERFLEHASVRWCFEDLTADLDACSSALEELGITVHPELARAVHERAANTTPEFSVPPYSEWPLTYRETFTRICGPVQERLGYDVDRALTASRAAPREQDSCVVSETPTEIAARLHPPTPESIPTVVKTLTLDDHKAKSANATVRDGEGELRITPASPAEAATVTLVAGDRGRGVPIGGYDYVTGSMLIDGPHTLTGRLVAVFRGEDGAQQSSQELTDLRAGHPLPFAFAPAESAAAWSLLLQITSDRPVLVTGLESSVVAAAPENESGCWTLAQEVPTANKASCKLGEGGMFVLARGEHNASAHVMLARGPAAWSRTSPNAGHPRGVATFVVGSIDLDASSTMGGRLFALFYDETGALLDREVVAQLRPEEGGTVFAFDLSVEVSHYCLAVHVGDQHPRGELRIRDLRHLPLVHDDHYRAQFGSVDRKTAVTMPG